MIRDSSSLTNITHKIQTQISQNTDIQKKDLLNIQKKNKRTSNCRSGKRSTMKQLILKSKDKQANTDLYITKMFTSWSITTVEFYFYLNYSKKQAEALCENSK